MATNKKDYVVRVHVYASDVHDASKKVAMAMTGRGLTWQVNECETEPAVVDTWRHNIETVRKFAGITIGGSILKNLS